MAVEMPDRQALPDGPKRRLVIEIHALYDAAGRPGVKRISTAIQKRNDLPDTVSHETVSQILHGALPGWMKLECLIRQLAVWAVGRPDPDETALRFHTLWIAAVDTDRAADSDTAAPEATALTASDTTAVDRALISNAPARPSDFFGRARILADLRRLVDDRRRGPVVITGPVGAGKTELAGEFAHDQANRYEIVWWIPASRPAGVRASLAALGERLGQPRSKDVTQIVRATLDALESTHRRWLLIFDDADDPEALAPMLPTGGAVVVTTRANWTGAGTLLEIGGFDRPESVELLGRHADEITPDEADRLADQLDDLPLALYGTATLQRTTALPLPECRALLSRHVSDLQSRPARPEHPVPVVAFVRMALLALRGRSPVAAELFELFAFLGPEPVPISLLRMGGQAEVPSSLGRALQRYDLVERLAGQLVAVGVARLDPQGETIQVHRVIRSILREELDRDRAGAVQAVTHRLLGAANPGDPDDPRTWSIHANLGPHLTASKAVRSPHYSVRRAIVDQVRYLERRGEYAMSLSLGDEAIATWDRLVPEGRLRPEDEPIFAAIDATADAMRALGRYDAAGETIEAALARLRGSAAYGDDHPSTMRLAGAAAVGLRLVGAYAKALSTDRVVVARHRRHDGENGEPTLRALGRLAASLRLNGLFAEAYTVDRQVRNGMTGLFGAQDPRTMAMAANLAADLYGLGRYLEGLELVERELPELIRFHGGRHEDVFRSKRMRVIGLRRTGRPLEAKKVADGYLPVAARLFEDTQPDMLLSTLTYTNVLWACGLVTKDRAAGMYSVFRRAFDGPNPASLAAAANYAIVLRTLGDRTEAYNVAKVTARELADVVGDDHPYTLAAANGLAVSMRLDGESESARTLSRDLVERARDVLGPEHPHTLVMEANLGRDLAAIHALDAGALRERTVDMLRAGGPHVPVDSWLECEIEPPDF